MGIGGLKEKICNVTGVTITYKDEWQNIPLSERYSGSFEIIDRDIIYCIPAGDSSDFEGVIKFLERREEILREMNLWDKTYYEIKDYSHVFNNPGRRSRMIVKDDMTRQENHMLGFVSHGASVVIRTIFKVAQKLFRSPINLDSVDTYEEAISKIMEYKKKPSKSTLLYPKTKSLSKKEFAKYLDFLIEDIGMINWNIAGTTVFESVSDDAPFKPVYDLLAVIKSDNDELIKSLLQKEEELHLANNKLKDTTDELSRAKNHLEDEVSRRTVELEYAKDRAEEAMQVKSRFLANMSHELRTPLHAILSFAEFGQKRFDTSTKEKIIKYFKRIHESGNRLLITVNDILDLSKLSSGKISYKKTKNSVVDTIRVVLTELSPLLHNKEIDVVFEDDVENKIAFYDNVRIMQVVRNLISNAIKFSPLKSTITIVLRDSFLIDDIKCKEHKAIEVHIVDEGIGVPEDELALVFEEFVQSSVSEDNTGGTGLGLPISKEIIENHCGQIWAMYNRDKPGSTFAFSIPIVPDDVSNQ